MSNRNTSLNHLKVQEQDDGAGVVIFLDVLVPAMPGWGMPNVAPICDRVLDSSG
jgi:hypothetical protein